MSKSTLRIALASRPASGFIGASFAHHLLHAPALRLAHEQPALAAPPEHVHGAARPFVVDEVAELALAQAGAEVLAELAVAHHLLAARAMAAEDRAQRRLRQVTVACEERVADGDARLRAEIAARKRLPIGPRALELREVRAELVHCVLCQAAVGGDLAAEY